MIYLHKIVLNSRLFPLDQNFMDTAISAAYLKNKVLVKSCLQ